MQRLGGKGRRIPSVRAGATRWAGAPNLRRLPGADPGRHWKLSAIDRYAGRHRPLAWIDDQFDDSCHRWAQARPAPTELVTTDPAVGLIDAHVSRVRAWAQTLTSGQSKAP